MLSKSKSNRIHLLKYALLIPLVFGMLVYTSSYAQKSSIYGISQAEKANQELTLKELTEKYYQELVAISKNQALGKEITEKYVSNTDKYINTKDEIARLQAFFKLISERMIETKRSEGTLSNEDIEKYDDVLKNYKTYDDYLAYKNTEKAKSSWEGNPRDGILRLVVNDMKKLTEAEREKYDQKVARIENDDYFHSLLMTDGKTSTRVEFHSIDGKVIPNPNATDDIQIVEESIEVPFSIIDDVPTTEDCKDLPDNDSKRQCFSNFISDFVNRNFNTNMANELGLTGRQRISVLFKIGQDGIINDVMSRGPHPTLEAEAIRVIKSLPQMIPGKQRGKAVIVPYSLPILFQIPDKSIEANNNLNPEKQDTKDLMDVPFSDVDEAPTFEECKSFSSNEQRKQCTTDKITDFVNRNFKTNLGKEYGLVGQQRITVVFIIDENGNIKVAKSKASSKVLENEAVRVVNTIPKMIPGQHKGKNVNVSYSLPILFYVSK